MIDYRPVPPEMTRDLRHRVMWPDKPLSHVILPEDAEALHLGAFDGGEMIGTASFFPSGERAARLRKLAVDPGYQGRGIGAGLVRAGAAALATRDVRRLWCDARQSAAGFYLRLGFRLSPEVFYKSGLPYQKAELEIPASRD